MAFQQLYYTSCETGLAGYGGYQFNAVTPGTSPLVMREVEDRSVYEPPRWLIAEPCLDEPEAYPIALSYAISEATGAVIVTHVMFAGTDYSGRPGNYFAHALVTNTPRPDFGSVLPAELWGAELWRGTPIESNELPELQGPLPRGVVDRPGVQAFLDARGTERVLPELLTAIWRAMAGDRLVLLASNDANENIWWIAAVSYLLGPRLASAMTFTTYSHRPDFSRHHLIGLQADAVPPDADSGFQLFDLDAGKTPGGVPHPLATLLAGTGVMATEDLWRQATAFASGTEQGPDDWLGPVAAATGLLRGQLSAGETDALVRWLPGAADRIPPQHAGVVLGVALDQPDAELADKQLVSLLDLARRLRSPVQAERLEQLLTGRAITRISRGEPAEPVRLSLRAAQGAEAEVSSLLRTAAPTVALAALGWAADSGAMPEETELDRYGRGGLDLNAAEPELTRLLRSYPAIRHGFLARLAHEPPQLAGRVLAGPAGALVDDDDLGPYPGLAEEMLLVSVAQRRLDPQRAFDRIVDIRLRSQRSPLVDAGLLGRLWPSECPPRRLVELLSVMAESPDPEVRRWFARQIEAASAHGAGSAGWLALAQALSDRRLLPLLPEHLAQLVDRTVAGEEQRHRIDSAVERGDLSIFADLYADYAAADDRVRLPQARRLAELFCRAEPLGEALRGCPDGVMAVFCEGLQTWLAPSRPDAMLAARVFTAITDPGVRPGHAERLAAVFEQVRDWHRRDIGYIGHLLSGRPEVAKQFQTWREGQRGGLVRKLLGGWTGPAEGR